MARAIVVGAGIAGLTASLALARRGHRVTLVEKDVRPVATDPDLVVSVWNRPGTPQGLLPHGFVALGRNLLRDRATDVFEALRQAGAREHYVGRLLPHGERIEGDEDLYVMLCRRPIFEWVLWETVARDPNIEILDDTAVAELVFTSDDRPPRVRGVRTRTGIALESDLVIDASGRRSRIRSMLHDAGVHMPDERTGECNMVYYARYFDRMPRTREIEGKWLFGPRVELPYGLVMVHLADARTFSVTFTVPTWDAELRALKDEHAWTAAVAAMPGMRAWTDLDVALPISDVLGMGGLRNVLRPFVADDGTPVVLGVLPVGDALCHTNAAYGWGASLGIAHAFAVVDALDAHGDDANALVRDYHARVWRTAESRYRASVEQDALRSSSWRGEPPATKGVAYGARMRELSPAMFADARVFRAVVRCALLLDPPEAIVDDDDLLAHARAVIARMVVPPPPAVPTREELLRTMSVAAMMGEIGER